MISINLRSPKIIWHGIQVWNRDGSAIIYDLCEINGVLEGARYYVPKCPLVEADNE